MTFSSLAKPALLAIICVFGIQTAYPQSTSNQDKLASAIIQSPEWKDFTEQVKNNYYKPVNEKDLMPACLQRLRGKEDLPVKEQVLICLSSVLNSLSLNSEYVSAEKVRAVDEQRKKGFVGIGLELGSEEGFLKIVSPIAGGPADKAGLKAGDLILSVDGARLRNLSLDRAVQAMRGDPGTNMKLIVARRDVDAPLEFNVTRQRILVKSVRYKLVEKGTAYLRISQLHDRTREESLAGISQLEQESNGALTNLIVDLRRNPGGLLAATVGVASLFLPEESVIVNSFGQLSTSNKQFRATQADYISKNNDLTEKPTITNLRNVYLIILVDRITAAGSEAIVAALQDYKRAKVIGESTAGIAEIRVFVPLVSGAGMWIKAAEMYSPKGSSWEGKGIIPDVHVVTEYSANFEFGDLGADKLLGVAIKYAKKQ